MAEWGRTTENVRWSMTSGQANPGGRAMMVHACQQNNEAWMGEFKDGFHATQTPAPNALFDECARENQGRLYQIGRSFLGRAERQLKKDYFKKVAAPTKNKGVTSAKAGKAEPVKKRKTVKR